MKNLKMAWRFLWPKWSHYLALALNINFANDNVSSQQFRRFMVIMMNIRPTFLTLLLVMAATCVFGDVDSPGGVGIYLGQDTTDYPVIQKIFADTPAAGAKLKEGQHITKVNGVSTSGKSMVDIIAMIRGPEMSAVELEILDADGKTFSRLVCRKVLNIRE